MKKKNKVLILALGVIALLTVTIIITSKKDKDFTGEVKSNFFLDTYSDLGVTGTNRDGFLVFCDASSGKTVFLCDKPNCEHNNPRDYTCNANIDGMVKLPAIYNNKLFFISNFESENDILYEADPNGGNRKAILELENTPFFSFFTSGVYKDNYLIVGYRKSYTYEDGPSSELVDLDKPIVEVVVINLKDHSVTYLPEKTAYDPSISLVHMYNNKIYYLYRYQNVKNDYTDFNNLDNDLRKETRFFEIYSYDIETDKESLLHKGQDMIGTGFSDEYIFLSEDLEDYYSIYSFNLLTNEKEMVISEVRYSVCYGDGERIVYRGMDPNGVEPKDSSPTYHYYYYDIKSKESFFIGSSEKVYGVDVIVEKHIYISYLDDPDDNESVRDAIILKSDFYKGDFDKKTEIQIR